MMVLHPLRKSDSEDGHSFRENSCDGFHKNETILKECLVFLTKDRSVVIVLVELLGWLIFQFLKDDNP